MKFDWSYYLDRISDLQTRNSFMAVSLQQKLDRYRLKPVYDKTSTHFASVLHSVQLSSGEMLYNEKTERKLAEEFLNHVKVYQEKVRRTLGSMDREIESNRNLCLRKRDEKTEKSVVIRDLRNETNAKFLELEKLTKRGSKWKMEQEKVHKYLLALQQSFSGDSFEPPLSCNLDGMRRNIRRLLLENKGLTSQNIYVSKELKMFELKLRGLKVELARNREAFESLIDDSRVPTAASSSCSASVMTMADESGYQFFSEEGWGKERFGEEKNNDDCSWFFEITGQDPTNGDLACNLFYKMTSSSCSLPAEIVSMNRSRVMEKLGRDFYTNWKDAQVMFGLAEALQHMATLRDLDAAVGFVMACICKLCDCDKASYWVIDKAREMAWTKVPSVRRKDEGSGGGPSSSMTTLMIPTHTGLVGAAFTSGEIINIADAYADPRFNRSVDLQTKYRTRSVLCFPIVLEGQIVGVAQCINKVSPSSSVFSDSDLSIVKTLGSAMLPVLASCHSHEESVKLNFRRSVLVEAAEEMTRSMRSRRDFLLILREKMRRMFRANDCAVVLIYKDFYAKIAIESDGGGLGLVSGTGGLIQHCVEKREPLHVFGSSVLQSKSFTSSCVDLDMLGNSPPTARGHQGDLSVHCWPIFSPDENISAVVQWACVDRSLIAFGDDGSFNERNHAHVDLVNRFMKLVGFCVEKFWPSKYRLTWTRAKHLQLKVRGMISFSAGHVSSGHPETPLRRSRIIGLWQKGGRLVVESLKRNNNKQQHSSALIPAPKPLAFSELFMQRMIREQENSPRRKTVVISQSSIEELRAIYQSTDSPYAVRKPTVMLEEIVLEEAAAEVASEFSADSE